VTLIVGQTSGYSAFMPDAATVQTWWLQVSCLQR